MLTEGGGTAMSKAVFDQDALYPFGGLLQGRISAADQLPAIERFLRAIVLHDEMVLVAQPMPRPGGPEEEPEWTEEEIAQGGRNVIVSFAPVLDDYDGLLRMERDVTLSSVEVAPRLAKLATDYSGAGPGDAYYKAHLGYLQRLASVLADGGSVVCEGDVGKEAFEARALPEELFKTLDQEWSEYAHAALDRIDFVLPPVLAIVLSRTARRQDLLRVVRGLRDEWAEPRRKLWDLIGQLRAADTTPKAALEIRRHIKEAEKLFSPKQESVFEIGRFLWDIFPPTMAAAVGAATGAAVGGAQGPTVSTAAFTAAAVTATARAVEKSMGSFRSAGGYFLRAGAYDLARRIQTELLRIEPIRATLSRHLTATEKSKLGL
jgi:hypothetical protein